MPVTDDELKCDVEDELDYDPKVDNSAVAVAAEAGVVTLRGTVGSYTEKCEAKRDALRVRGVTRVDDELQVELLDENARDDADLRGAVLEALMLNSLVPSTVDAKVNDGWVTLVGTASSQFQRTEAEHVTGRVRGVSQVSDEITVVPFGPSPKDVSDAITQALERTAHVDASTITVQSSSGTVTLGGHVRSWAEHDDALLAAWNAPGVVNVIDNLTVSAAGGGRDG
jgi:osmotically-inducible protein OsmY